MTENPFKRGTAVIPGRLKDGTPVRVWFINGCLQTDHDGDKEITDEPIYDLTGKPFPNFFPQNPETQKPDEKFWANVRVVDPAGTTIGLES